jgi:hypothetical protein
MLLSVQKHLYGGAAMTYRYMNPADLRPYVEPPAHPKNMGSYVSPIRFTVPIQAGDDLWSLSRRISQQVYTASKRGEKYLASVMTEGVMRMVFNIKIFRMATTALTFSGASQLEETYGPFKVRGIRGFTSNFGQGPEYTAQVGIFNDELWWDILYLDKDMSPARAQEIAEEITFILDNSLSPPQS